MTWFKVDDRLHSHPKAVAAGGSALGVWVVAGSWCGAYGSDGAIDLQTLLRLFADDPATHNNLRGLADRLVSVGLWERDGRDKWRFHHWAQWQPTAEDITRNRQARAAAGRRGGQATAQANAQARAQATAQAPAASACSTPVPSRPVPSRPEEIERETFSLSVDSSRSERSIQPETFTAPPNRRSQRSPKDLVGEQEEPRPSIQPGEPARPVSRHGTRLPPEWTPAPATVAALRRELGRDPLACLPTFRDYWHARAGAGAVKLDWEATFRNWARRDAKDLPELPAPPPVRRPVPTYTPEQRAAMRKQADEALAKLTEMCLPVRDPMMHADVRLPPQGDRGVAGTNHAPGPPDAPAGILGAKEAES